MNKILVLGGAGFIGSNITKSLANSGKKVIVFGSHRAYWKNVEHFNDKIEIIKGDLSDSTILEKIFKENKIDIVIHLISSSVPSTQLCDVIEHNELFSTMKLLDIMSANKVTKLIYFSSGGAVYGVNGEKINKEDSPLKPITFYGWLKVTIENYIQMRGRTHELDYLILRVSNPYGENQNILGNLGLIAVTLGKLLHNKPAEVWGDGEVVRDYIYIDDMCEITLSLIEKGNWNNIYNIGRGKGSSINEVLRIIKKISGINFNTDYKESRSVDIPVNILDISKIKKDIPLLKLTSLEKGIKKYWESLKK